MFFDTSFVYEIQNMVFQIQRMAIGGVVVIMVFSLLRMLLWALFSLNMNRVFASLSANLVTGALAFVVFTQPGLRETAIAYGYGLACYLAGGNLASGSLTNLPGLGGVENMLDGAVNDMVNQIRSAFPF